MAADHVPINLFVEQTYSTRQVQALVEGWRLESKVVIDRLVDHFRDMGIFHVTRLNEKVVVDGIYHQLKNSPEILRLVMRAQAEENRRAKTRHGGSAS